MSVIVLDGRRFVTGLYWFERESWASVGVKARRYSRPWYVHLEEQTGYAERDPDDGGWGARLDGLPALAAVLKRRIGQDFWMALVAGEGPEGGERFALVKVRDGMVLTDGDRVFTDRAEAVKAFDQARNLGWSLHATPGLVAGAAVLDVAALAVAPDLGLRRAPFVACVAAGTAVWMHRGEIVEVLFGPEPVPVVEAVEPMVTVRIDSVALLEGCRRALAEWPPYLAAWQVESVSCYARFADQEFTRVYPELAGRAMLLAKWRLKAGYSEALHRRIVEKHLSGWFKGSVVGDEAWGLNPLAPVLRRSDEVPAPSFLAFRAVVDRRFGGFGAGIEYSRTQAGWTVRIESREPLGRIGEVVLGIPGLEVVSVGRTGGGWRLEGRPVRSEAMLEYRFDALTEEIGDEA